MKFITRCTRCGAQNQLGNDENTSVQVYFHKGTPNTMDRMVIYCESCGNKHEIEIDWPMNVNTPNGAMHANGGRRCPLCHGTGEQIPSLDVEEYYKE